MVKKILVIDDDSNDLDTMKLILEKAKYQVSTSDNGADALDLIMGDKPHLILIDIKMPTLSGYDLLRLMRQRLNHHVKIAYVSIVPKSTVDLTDIDGFIQKPFMSVSLLKEVNRLLK